MRKLSEKVALGFTFARMKEGDFSRCFHDRGIWQIEGAAERKARWQGIEQIQGTQDRYRQQDCRVEWS